MFGYDYTLNQWLFFFYFYCFCGWCFESTYVSIRTKKITNRGFMRGPFLPLYGSGGMMMLIVSSPFQDNIFLTYLSGVVGATILEYVTGVGMEHLFKVRYWDYSYRKFQFQGHICLRSSLAWGGLTIAMTHVVHKPVEHMVLSIPTEVLSIVITLLNIIIVSDFSIAFRNALDVADLLVKMNKMKDTAFGAAYLVRNRATETANSMRERASEAAYTVKTNAVSAASTMKTSAVSAASSVKNNAVSAASSVKSNAASAASTVKSTAVEAAYTAKDELTEWKERVSGVIGRYIPSERSRAYHRSVFRGNPDMTSVEYREALEELKRDVIEKREEDEN